MRRVLIASLVLALGCATTQNNEAPPPPKPDEVEQPAVSEPQRKQTQELLAEEQWRKTPPEPAKPSELVLPKFQTATLKNGMQIWVSERHELPIVSINVAIKAGSSAEPAAKDGIADFTYELFLEGAGGKDAFALDKAFGALGTSAAVVTMDDGAIVGAEALVKNADGTLALLADLVQRPRFAQEDFERNKQRKLQQLAAQLGSPGFLAMQAYAPVVFGEKHPYGHTGAGTPKSVASFTLADVKAFYKKAVGPQAAALIITGDVTLEQAKAWGEKHFGKWKATAKPMPAPKPVAASTRKNVVLVPKEGLNQTIIYMGRPAIQTGHPDEAALELATAVFGGFFGSRLNMNLREDKGYSYGATAGVDPRRGVGPLTARSSVRADATGPSVAEFFNELNGMKSKPITDAELAAAREGLVRSFPGLFESVGGIASAAAGLYFEDQPVDRFEKLIAGLQKADMQQVQAAAEKYLDPSMLQIVLVGDPLLVQNQVGPLELGELVTREPPQPVMPGQAKAGK